MAIVKLGEFIFTKSELPDYIPFGGEQALAVHQLVGGQRVIDAMGTLEPDITWSGIFIGTLMLEKARYLDSLMREAKPLTFTYNQFRYNVLIKRFNPQYRDTHVEYAITLQVIENLTKPVIFFPQLTWIEAFKQLLLEVEVLADLIKNGNITDKIGALKYFMNQMPDSGSMTQEQITKLIGYIDQAGGAVDDVSSIISGGLFG